MAVGVGARHYLLAQQTSSGDTFSRISTASQEPLSRQLQNDYPHNIPNEKPSKATRKQTWRAAKEHMEAKGLVFHPAQQLFFLHIFLSA